MSVKNLSKKELSEKIETLEKKRDSEGLERKESSMLKKLKIEYTHRISGFNRVKVVSGGAAGSIKK